MTGDVETIPHRAEELAGGIAGVAVLMNNEGYVARGFHIVRPDGSTKDFSYRVALDGKTKGPTIQEACLQAVGPDIVAYRDARLAAGPQCCAVSGELLTPLNMHVNHAGEWPFRRIVREFVEWAVQERRSLRLVESGICTVEFADPQMTEEFRAFHNARAVLRLVTQEVNQSWEREAAARKAAARETTIETVEEAS